jgi:hypothetical protein
MSMRARKRALFGHGIASNMLRSIPYWGLRRNGGWSVEEMEWDAHLNGE